MRVQHVWAKTGTSPVAFHNTTVDVALCPATERRPVACSPRSKAQMPHIERTRPTLALPAPLTRMANRTACALVAPPLLRRPAPGGPAPGAPRPGRRRPTSRGAIPPVGQPRGPCGDSLVRLGRSRRLWRLGSSRAVPDGRRAASARPEPRLCSFWVAFFRPQASACSEGGAMRPERHTMTPLSALVGVHGDGGDVVPLPGRHRPPPDEDHGVGARPERLGDAVRRLASSTSGLIAVGGLLAGGGLLVDGIFGAV